MDCGDLGALVLADGCEGRFLAPIREWLALHFRGCIASAQLSS
ncbi:MAG: hypothetical protein PHF94_00835 [Methanothrix sp.]|nr:hypothetical protein [Methanothrix sp.]